MCTKITASEERVFRLQWLPEDDTMFMDIFGVSSSEVLMNRPGVAAPGRFFIAQMYVLDLNKFQIDRILHYKYLFFL